jgi:hypothetical protein
MFRRSENAAGSRAGLAAPNLLGRSFFDAQLFSTCRPKNWS